MSAAKPGVQQAGCKVPRLKRSACSKSPVMLENGMDNNAISTFVMMMPRS